MGNPAYYQASLVSQVVEQNEHRLHLYMSQHYEGASDANQKIILPQTQANFFGCAWTVFDDIPSKGKLVGRAKGLHLGVGINEDSWFYSFHLVFNDARFKAGSSLKLDGMQDQFNGEWAVVGGTGEFAGANGTATFVIDVRSPETAGWVNWELSIRFLCPIFTKQTHVVKIEQLVGGNGGNVVDVEDKLQRLLSVTIRHGDVIDSISFSYVDEVGKTHTSSPWGGNGGLSETIKIKPTETVKKIMGTTGCFGGHVVVNSLKVVTNLDTYGPYGKGNGTRFAIPQKDNSSVVCFHGRAGLFLDAIGIYATEN